MARAKKKVKPKPVGGPFLAAAVFCDNILTGADGALSAIRIVDRIDATVPSDAPPNVPSDSKRLPVAIRALLMFKSGSATGEHDVHLAIHSPSGEKTPGPKTTLMFTDAPTGGANLKLHLGLAIYESGLYIVDILLDGKRITRMPLSISVSRGEAPQPKPAARAKPKRKRAAEKRAR